MTLVLTAHFGDCIKILTDAASYDREGRISAIGEKIARAPDIPLVLASCGEEGLCQWVRAAFLDFARCGSVDATLIKLQSLLFGVHAELRITGTFRVFVAGRTDSGALFHLSACNKPPYEGVKPMELVCTSHIMANGTTGDTAGLAIPPETVDEDTFEAFALPFAELQRATTALIPGLDEALPIRMVGGALHLTTIDAGGVATQTLHTWSEDRVGAPIDTQTWHSAALFLDVPSNPSSPTRVSIRADQFVVSNGSGAGADIGQPLVFQRERNDQGEMVSVLRLHAVKLRDADIKNLNVDFARVKNLRITKKMIVDEDAIVLGAIDTLRLEKGAVTAHARGSSGTMKDYTSTNWVTVDQFSIANLSAMPVFCDFDWDASATTPGGSSGGTIGVETRLVRVQGNNHIQVNSRTYGAARNNQIEGSGTTPAGGQELFLDYDTGWAGGSRTYRLQVRVTKGGAVNGAYSVKARCAVKMVCWKR